MESHDIADFPRPVHHRIPNFKGSYLAGQSIRDLEVFAGTQEVKVDPDKPLEGVRLLALQCGKHLLALKLTLFSLKEQKNTAGPNTSTEDRAV